MASLAVLVLTLTPDVLDADLEGPPLIMDKAPRLSQPRSSRSWHTDSQPLLLWQENRVAHMLHWLSKNPMDNQALLDTINRAFVDKVHSEAEP